jgi:mannose-6-phosphate isomerase-like protein (cupin superfamily)
VIEGDAQVMAGEELVQVGQYQTVIIPAETGRYQVRPSGRLRVLKSSVEEV